MTKERASEGPKSTYNLLNAEVFQGEERPGTSVFYKDAAGQHLSHTLLKLRPAAWTSSSAAYNWLDLAPKGPR